MSHYIPGSHLPAHDGFDIVSGRVGCPIKSMDHIMLVNPCPPLANINGQDVSSSPIGATSSDLMHPFYPDLSMDLLHRWF